MLKTNDLFWSKLHINTIYSLQDSETEIESELLSVLGARGHLVICANWVSNKEVKNDEVTAVKVVPW